MAKLKLCGIRREEDVSYLNEFPPDYAGFIFAPTRRYVSPETAKMLISRLDPRIKSVGVFVDMPISEMKKFADMPDVFQLHGGEDEVYISQLRKIIPEKCEIWKAVRLKVPEDIDRAEILSVDRLLIDAYDPNEYGGTGKSARIDLIVNREIAKPFFIAGGISAENIAEVNKLLGGRAYGFDVSSGIETDGVKDREKIHQLTEKFRKELI
ncbi:MAG: phosphoribosylanthranilate isomerase [Oscillospiraceae bacterium]|nr:phosphoribosylanthranilate isomerase [Oscillospiraceae bacterium]